jgi:hypothetical protein
VNKELRKGNVLTAAAGLAVRTPDLSLHAAFARDYAWGKLGKVIVALMHISNQGSSWQLTNFLLIALCSFRRPGSGDCKAISGAFNGRRKDQKRVDVSSPQCRFA